MVRVLRVSACDVLVASSLVNVVSLGGGGPNHGIQSWGQKLLAYYGKNRQVSLSDFTTNMLGNSTGALLVPCLLLVLTRKNVGSEFFEFWEDSPVCWHAVISICSFVTRLQTITHGSLGAK